MVWELKGGLLLAKESQKELSFRFFFSTFRSVSFSFCKRKNLKKYKLSPTSSNDCSIWMAWLIRKINKFYQGQLEDFKCDYEAKYIHHKSLTKPSLTLLGNGARTSLNHRYCKSRSTLGSYKQQDFQTVGPMVSFSSLDAPRLGFVGWVHCLPILFCYSPENLGSISLFSRCTIKSLSFYLRMMACWPRLRARVFGEGIVSKTCSIYIYYW